MPLRLTPFAKNRVLLCQRTEALGQVSVAQAQDSGGGHQVSRMHIMVPFSCGAYGGIKRGWRGANAPASVSHGPRTLSSLLRMFCFPGGSVVKKLPGHEAECHQSIMSQSVLKLSPASLMFRNDAERPGRLMSFPLPGLKPSIPALHCSKPHEYQQGTHRINAVSKDTLI